MLAALGLVSFTAGVLLRPDAAVGLVVLGTVFVVLERVVPRRPQPVLRPGVATDCVHFVLDEVIAALVLAVLLGMLVPPLRFALPDPFPDAIQAQPRWLVTIEA
ncbi:MAG TPA: hypothetical protein VF855_00630, partial [Acidimicrobiales bacterium]